MSPSRASWNQRWKEKNRKALEPDPWLVRVLPLLPKGEALDIACGQGRNAVFLAEHGFKVTGYDISDQGLEQLRAEGQKRNLEITLKQIDLEKSPDLPRLTFDVVLNFFYLQRSLFSALMKSVRPGGVVVVRTFSSAGNFPGPPGNPDFVLEPGELLRIFSGWDILIHEEGLEPSKKGGSLTGIVARRPLK